jgi:glycosyltransferase involved in cell wall biosynthesis
MRICHVTNYWPNRFGHAHYTEALIQGMRVHRPEQHLVAGEGTTAAADTEEHRVLPCWNRFDNYVEDVVRGVVELKADIALLQYSGDVFGDDNRLPMLLSRLGSVGVKTVLNDHSVYPPEWRSGYVPGHDWGALDRALGRAATCINVHSRRCKHDLVARGLDPSKISVIPHGSKIQPQADRLESRRRLGIPEDAKVMLFFGYVWLGKGLDPLLDVFARLQKRVPDSFFYIGGYTRHKFLYTRAYMTYLRARIQLLGIRRRTRLWGDFVPEEMVVPMYSAADVVALPYRQDFSSVSGVVHQAAGLGKLFLCSRVTKFDEVGESISPELLVAPHDKEAWAERLERLLTDRPYAEEMTRRISRFAEETSWSAVGQRHLELYERLLAGKPAADDTDGPGSCP